ncbi:MAG: PHP-associated domain-containing protein [Candidatus Anstonellales archaeon]
MKIDFHVHTYASRDGIITYEKIAKISKEKGIVPAITDHNTIKAHKPLRKLGLEFIPGEEITTDRGDLIGLFINEEIPRKTEFFEAIDLIKEQGGISLAPHMYDFTRSAIGEIAQHADLIEALNARCLQEHNEKAKEFAKEKKKIGVAGSDTHYEFEFGKVWNEVDLDELEPKKLMRALKKVRLYGTPHNPILVRGSANFIKLFKCFGLWAPKDF